MKITIAGATGLIGSALTKALRADGHEVVALSRKPGTAGDVPTTVWDPATSGLPPVARDGADAFVNLAGVSIGAGRWTASHRRAILDSRLVTTRGLVDAVEDGAPATFICGSAVGYYGPGENPVDESAPAGDDFLANVCVQWEAEANKAAARTRVVTLRSGVVLARNGGALRKLLVPARLGIGGPMAGGQQWMSWVHIDDEVGLLRHLLGSAATSGPVNATAPNPVRQAELAKALGRALHRPAFVPTPAFALRLVLGRAADMVITGQRALPKVALASGYQFLYPELEPALRALLVPYPS